MNFNRMTGKLLQTASNGRINIRAFEQHFPGIVNQIRADADSKWLGLWGLSRNFDEYEHQKIVDPKLLTTIGRLAKTPIRIGDGYHAGLMHTYGYLFSRLKTRFGYKRERWTAGVLEKGLGLPDNTFSHRPVHGTLLENLTVFLAQASLRTISWSNYFEHQHVAPCLLDFPYRQFRIRRIEETVEVKKTKKQTLSLFTDLIAFKNETNGSALLVYSYAFRGCQRLITCFPISSSFEAELLTLVRENSAPIKPRFNAEIDVFPTGAIMGTRKMIELQN